MRGELTRRALARKVAELAFAPAGDAVGLALSGEPDTAGLDLRLVAEIKRGRDGGVELKLMDRLKLIELLEELLPPEENEGSRSLYSAIDGAARALGEKSDAV